MSDIIWKGSDSVLQYTHDVLSMADKIWKGSDCMPKCADDVLSILNLKNGKSN